MRKSKQRLTLDQATTYQVKRRLAERLGRAEQALLALTSPPGRDKRQWDDLEVLQEATDTSLKKHRVEGFLEVHYKRDRKKGNHWATSQTH